MSRLDDTEIERYSRQLLLREVGEVGQLRLRGYRAVVVGCGGLGVPAASYLVAAGVGEVRLVDGDRVSLDNLQRQVAFTEGDIGLAKAAALAAHLRGLNSAVSVTAVERCLDPELPDEVFDRADLVLECSDSPRLKFGVNDFCVARRLPLVVGGAIQWQGQLVRVSPGGPCYRCLFGAAPAQAEVTCRQAGVFGPVVGVIGAAQALEGLKLLLGLGQDWPSQLLQFDALRSQWRGLRLRRDPNCPVHVPVPAELG